MDEDEYALICSLDEYPRGGDAHALSVSEEAITAIKRQAAAPPVPRLAAHAPAR
jgi:hypothetical protein